jgi:ureidoacrylate peracid hydrolase
MNKIFSILSLSANPPVAVTVEAEPQPLEVDLKRTGLVIIDMQNGAASKGGMFDLQGVDLSEVTAVTENIKRLSTALRRRGGKVVYVVHLISPDLHESGGPLTPGYYRSPSARLYREKPEWRDKLLIRGAWGGKVIDELTPLPGDPIVEKTRYSAFFETNMDTVLRTYDLKYLLFTGTETSMCVDSSLRDAAYRGYFCVLVSDAAVSSHVPHRREATLSLVRGLGWVATTESVAKALQA